LFVQRSPPQRPGADARGREQTTAAVRNALDALEVLVGQADSWSRFLSGYWDLTARHPPDLCDALAVTVLVTQASGCISEFNIALAAARLRAADEGG
jgi:hypothetical protein